MTSEHIIHLDDHTLFARAVESIIPELGTPALYRHFSHPDAALEYVDQCLRSGTQVHALITDFNHPGADGYEFAGSVKELEKQYGQRVPILLLTMMGPEQERIHKGLEERVFDQYLSKASSKEEILAFLNR